MEKYADAVVGVAGEGLNVEQRKRLTIGVELTAKPKLLVFLDEPTSGLDSQTAWSICQLMKKLANHGQAILCTIHQPSAILMQEFDRLLFMQRGGKTVYFGDLGEGCKTMIDYFESHGAHKCPADANPAEWMLEVVGAAPGSHANQDYYEVWRNSEEYRAVQSELDWMERELPKKGSITAAEDKHEFSQSIIYQTKLVSIRLFQQYWRSPDYLWSKFILTIFNQLSSVSLSSKQEPRYRVYKIKCWLYSCLRLFSILFYNNIYHLLSSKEICMRPGNAPQGLFLGFHLSSLKYSWKFHGIYWQVLLLILSSIIQLDFTPTRLQLASCMKGVLYFGCSLVLSTFMLVLWVCLSFLSTKLQKVQLT